MVQSLTIGTGAGESLTPGEFVDVAVLSDDLFAVDDDAIRDLHSVLTVGGGRVVHDDLTD